METEPLWKNETPSLHQKNLNRTGTARLAWQALGKNATHDEVRTWMLSYAQQHNCSPPKASSSMLSTAKGEVFGHIRPPKAKKEISFDMGEVVVLAHKLMVKAGGRDQAITLLKYIQE